MSIQLKKVFFYSNIIAFISARCGGGGYQFQSDFAKEEGGYNLPVHASKFPDCKRLVAGSAIELIKQGANYFPMIGLITQTLHINKANSFTLLKCFL